MPLLDSEIGPETNNIRRILIIGDNYISQSILLALSNKSYTVTLLTYPHQRPNLPSNIIHQSLDLASQSLTRVFQNQDLVISTISPSDHELQKRIVDSCIGTHVSRFIPCEFGLDCRNPRIQELLPSYGSRARMIHYLQETELEWVGLATGVILDRSLLDGRLGVDLRWHSASLPGSGKDIMPVSSSKRIGEVVAAVIEGWKDVKNRYLLATGRLGSIKEVVEILEDAIGAKFKVNGIDLEDLMREAERRLEGGWPDAGWILKERCAVFGSDTNSAKAFRESEDRTQLGLHSESVEAIVKDTVHQWRHQQKGDCGCS